MNNRSYLSLVAVLLTSLCFADPNTPDFVSVDHPPTDNYNRHYVCNRPPLVPTPLVSLPVGAISAQGWLRHQLSLEAIGMVGHLPELSTYCVFAGNAWADPKGLGHSPWEELPYWLRGYGKLGYLIGDQRIIQQFRQWIDAVMQSQQSDGWFGPQYNRYRWGKDKGPDLWPNMLMCNALQTHYDVTQDRHVLTFLLKYFRFVAALPDQQLLPYDWQKYRGGDMLATIYWLYDHTNEPWLLKLAERVHANTHNWTNGIATFHGVNIAQGFREPAIYYMQNHDELYLVAPYRNYNFIWDRWGQMPGGLFAADEYARFGYTDPRQAAETCTVVEFMRSCQMLAVIGGDPAWLDRCEDVAFNTFPATRPANLRAVHYLTAPNQIKLDRAVKVPAHATPGPVLAYNPWDYRCCRHNVGIGWPDYVQNLWHATSDNGLCASLYAPSEVTAKVGTASTVQVTEVTDYPFGETITFAINIDIPAEFPMYLRIPRWCSNPDISLNGKTLSGQSEQPGYVKLDRIWQDGDTVQLSLPMELRLTTWHANAGSVSISHGPLTFALAIEEQWSEFIGRRDLTDAQKQRWPAWEVFPKSHWNYGLQVGHGDPCKYFKVVRNEDPLAVQPFTPQNAPVKLLAKGRRIPQWKEDSLGLVGELSTGPILSKEPLEEITLIPMGCTRLRISAFPKVRAGRGAVPWKSRPVEILASYANPSDSPRALHDATVSTSDDWDVPRFTFAPRKGTTESVTYRYREPRELFRSGVYFFAQKEGDYQPPRSWRLLYKDGSNFKPVELTEGRYSTALDTFNWVAFEPITTTEIRLEMTLQDDASAGMLEWKAE